MHPVKSSNVEAIGHDGTALHVKFKNGGEYRYAGVPAQTFNKLKAADSVGKYLREHIVPHHTATKLA